MIPSDSASPGGWFFQMKRRGELEACLSCQLRSRLRYSSRLPFRRNLEDWIMPGSLATHYFLRIALTCFNLPKVVRSHQYS
jgi:hypothetical protein